MRKPRPELRSRSRDLRSRQGSGSREDELDAIRQFEATKGVTRINLIKPLPLPKERLIPGGLELLARIADQPPTQPEPAAPIQKVKIDKPAKPAKQKKPAKPDKPAKQAKPTSIVLEPVTEPIFAEPNTAELSRICTRCGFPITPDLSVQSGLNYKGVRSTLRICRICRNYTSYLNWAKANNKPIPTLEDYVKDRRAALASTGTLPRRGQSYRELTKDEIKEYKKRGYKLCPGCKKWKHRRSEFPGRWRCRPCWNDYQKKKMHWIRSNKDRLHRNHGKTAGILSMSCG